MKSSFVWASSPFWRREFLAVSVFSSDFELDSVLTCSIKCWAPSASSVWPPLTSSQNKIRILLVLILHQCSDGAPPPDDISKTNGLHFQNLWCLKLLLSEVFPVNLFLFPLFSFDGAKNFTFLKTPYSWRFMAIFIKWSFRRLWTDTTDEVDLLRALQLEEVFGFFPNKTFCCSSAVS